MDKVMHASPRHGLVVTSVSPMKRAELALGEISNGRASMRMLLLWLPLFAFSCRVLKKTLALSPIVSPSSSMAGQHTWNCENSAIKGQLHHVQYAVKLHS